MNYYNEKGEQLKVYSPKSLDVDFSYIALDDLLNDCEINNFEEGKEYDILFKYDDSEKQKKVLCEKVDGLNIRLKVLDTEDDEIKEYLE